MRVIRNKNTIFQQKFLFLYSFLIKGNGSHVTQERKRDCTRFIAICLSSIFRSMTRNFENRQFHGIVYTRRGFARQRCQNHIFLLILLLLLFFFCNNDLLFLSEKLKDDIFEWSKDWKKASTNKNRLINSAHIDYIYWFINTINILSNNQPLSQIQ